jgi:hypothetical protein
MNKLKFTAILAIVLGVGFIFIDDAASKNNRMIDRMNGAQIDQRIITVGHLLSPIN